jgi:hypothetical protein
MSCNCYENELKIMLIKLLPDYIDAKLELLTATAKVESKGKAITLELHYGVDGYDWE